MKLLCEPAARSTRSLQLSHAGGIAAEVRKRPTDRQSNSAAGPRS